MLPDEQPGLDLRIVIVTATRLFVPWLASVLLVTWAGYPGVVCVTPLAWLLALRVGLRVAMRSASASPRSRLTEAGLAGGIFGFLQGLLFIGIVGGLGKIRPEEQTNAFILNAAMLLGGALAAAGLAVFNGWLYMSRLRRQSRSGPDR